MSHYDETRFDHYENALVYFSKATEKDNYSKAYGELRKEELSMKELTAEELSGVSGGSTYTRLMNWLYAHPEVVKEMRRLCAEGGKAPAVNYMIETFKKNGVEYPSDYNIFQVFGNII